jgi:hypothetical protein
MARWGWPRLSSRLIRHVDLDVDGVAQFQRAEHARVRLDPELGLHHRRAGPVPAVRGPADLQAERAGLAVQSQGAGDHPATAAVRLELRRAERRVGKPVGLELLAGRRGDLIPVPVVQRLDAAGSLANLQGAQLDPRLETGRGAVRAVQVGPPVGDLDGQVVPGLGREAGAVCTQREPATVRTESVAPSISRHASTVGHK